MKEQNTMYFDGSCTLNKGERTARYGYIIYFNYGKEIFQGKGIVSISETTTNNVAEYTALIEGLKRAINVGINDIIIKGDSMLVVKQVQGVYKVYSKLLIPLHCTVKELLAQMEVWSIVWVPRQYNKVADRLSR
jgi:ribonuclease HI